MGILIIGDSESSRLALESSLREAGHEPILQASSPQQALEIVQYSVEDGGAVDVILLDLSVSHEHLSEAVSQIKSRLSAQDIPILAFVDGGTPESLQPILDAGALECVGKGMATYELTTCVRLAVCVKKEINRRKECELRLGALLQRLDGANEKIKHLSDLDGLTGVANLRYFTETMDKEWNRAVREYSPVSVVLMNVDRFEAFNERYGHLRGDVCLKRVAGAVREALNRPGDVLARYGGDEFIVLLPNTALEGATKVAETISANIAKLAIKHADSESGPYVTLSQGVASTSPAGTTDAPELIAAAEGVLLEARSLGGNQLSKAQVGKTQSV